MTSPYDQIRADVAAAEAADQAKDTAHAADQATIAADEAKIAELEAELHPRAAVAWGSSVMPYGAETYPQALARVETALKPDLLRYFVTGTSGPVWPTRTGTHPLVISFKLPPRDVLSGAHDAQLSAWFARTPQPTRWSYWHEPEDDIARGAFTAADYRNAWTRIAGLAKASGKPLRSVLILMGYSLKPASHRTWTDYYPGPDVIDVLGWDCYATTAADTPATVYGAARSTSQAAGKPWAICETGVGSVQHPDPAVRAGLLTALAHDLATVEPRPEFVTYFDSDPDYPKVGYGWNVSRDPAAAAAWVKGRA